MTRPLSPIRAPRLWTAWAIIVLSLIALVWSLLPRPELAELDGFAQATAYLREQADEGTFVLVWPPEQARSLTALPRELHAADALPIEEPTARRYPQVLVIGPAGFAPPPELAAARAESRRGFGAVEVAAYSYTGRERVLFDLRRSLEQAAVKLVGPEGEVQCTTRRPDGGWSCPGRPDWNHVAPTVLEVEGRDYACLWAHPVAGHELVIELAPRERGDELRLSAALSDAAVATPEGAPVELALEVEGAGTRTLVRSNERGVAQLSVPISRPSARLRLTVKTRHDGRRHLGINLEGIAKRAPAPTTSPADP